VYHLTKLERCSANKLQENCNADPECVAAKKTKLLAASCSHENECALPAVCSEMDYCNQLLNDPHTNTLPWHSTLIRRHLAWTQRLCQPKFSTIVSFHNSLSA